MFWLPLFLVNKDANSQVGYISAMLDVGGLIGGLIGGHLGDRYGRRALFLSPCLFLGSILMLIVSLTFTNVVWMYYVAMFLIGSMLGGPYRTIGSVITYDIGKQSSESNVAKVSALIEGSAAIFAALTQFIVSLIPC